jgi:hypothetical protein
MQLLLAALAIVVASLGAFSGPAVADDWNNHNRWNDNWNNNWRWDNNHDNDNWWGWNNRWDNDNWWGWNRWEEVQDCPFWGDTEGIVNQWDCLD